MPLSTLGGSCTCQPGRGCSIRYSCRAVASSPRVPPTPKAATFTALVPTSRPMMTSAELSFTSRRLDGISLAKDGVNEILVAAEPWHQDVQNRRDGFRHVTRVRCLLGGRGS